MLVVHCPRCQQKLALPRLGPGQAVRCPKCQQPIQPPPEAMVGTSGRYLRGVANVDGRIILVLDVAGVLDAAVH